VSLRPSSAEARRRVLVEAARFDGPFTIEDAWRAVGRGRFPSYQHVQTLLRELMLAGELRVVRRPDVAAKPVVYEWVEDAER
jgi:hypothetical protein